MGQEQFAAIMPYKHRPDFFDSGKAKNYRRRSNKKTLFFKTVFNA